MQTPQKKENPEPPSQWLASPNFALVARASTLYFVVMWLLSMPLKNAGLVDLAWPSSFAAIALLNGITGNGPLLRRFIITSMFVICGLRFNLGWIQRTRLHGEDPRWELWRKRWRSGQGWFGIKSVMFNLFWFFQAQNLANIFWFALPSFVSSQKSKSSSLAKEERVSPNRSTSSREFLGLHVTEWLGVALWAFSLYMETRCDLQLSRFKSRSKRDPSLGKVCRDGMWAYSRHPNYFFEFLVWIGYLLFSWRHARAPLDKVGLASLPLVGYWFLVHFTGVPLTELGSLRNRGEPYARYQKEVNMFFPWFPKTGKR